MYPKPTLSIGNEQIACRNFANDFRCE